MDDLVGDKNEQDLVYHVNSYVLQIEFMPKCHYDTYNANEDLVKIPTALRQKSNLKKARKTNGKKCKRTKIMKGKKCTT